MKSWAVQQKRVKLLQKETPKMCYFWLPFVCNVSLRTYVCSSPFTFFIVFIYSLKYVYMEW